MKKFLASPLGKAIIEALRWGALVFVSAVVRKLLELIPGLELDPSFVLILTAILRFIDAALHKSGVAEKGIVRF